MTQVPNKSTCTGILKQKLYINSNELKYKKNTFNDIDFFNGTLKFSKQFI